MTDTPLSIIVPMNNVERYVRRYLQSVLNVTCQNQRGI